MHFLADTGQASSRSWIPWRDINPFETAFACTYVGKFTGNRDLEEKFRDYAAKDFGTILQQADND